MVCWKILTYRWLSYSKIQMYSFSQPAMFACRKVKHMCRTCRDFVELARLWTGSESQSINCRSLWDDWLPGWWWLEPWNFMTFHSVGNVIFPTDFHSIIFQRGRYTTNEYCLKFVKFLHPWRFHESVFKAPNHSKHIQFAFLGPSCLSNSSPWKTVYSG